MHPLWYALWSPKGTPKDVTTKLNAAVVDLRTRRSERRLADLGMEIFTARPADAGSAELTFTKRRSKNGGRSSRPLTSLVNDQSELHKILGKMKLRAGLRNLLT